ncbi:MAG: putative rane protein [Herbinix sp.]|nr:putative rane protein [Herbinix sp.]
MNNAKLAYFLDTIKHIFSLKRTKITLYMVVVLWLAVVTQVIVNRVFHEELRITEAFVKSNAEEMQSSIEVIAEYSGGFLSEEDKKSIIESLADAIGLEIDREIKVDKEGVRTEYYYYKKAKQATSEIKVVSIEQEEDAAVKTKHYIIVRLGISKSIESIDRYKSKIENALEKLGVNYQQITMQFDGTYEGSLTAAEKNDIVSLLVDELQGKKAIEYDEGDLYTVYAYTGLLNEYIVSNGYKVNIQIAITYNELTNRTKVTLATPILNHNW